MKVSFVAVVAAFPLLNCLFSTTEARMIFNPPMHQVSLSPSEDSSMLDLPSSSVVHHHHHQKPQSLHGHAKGTICYRLYKDHPKPESQWFKSYCDSKLRQKSSHNKHHHHHNHNHGHNHDHGHGHDQQQDVHH